MHCGFQTWTICTPPMPLQASRTELDFHRAMQSTFVCATIEETQLGSGTQLTPSFAPAILYGTDVHISHPKFKLVHQTSPLVISRPYPSCHFPQRANHRSPWLSPFLPQTTDQPSSDIPHTPLSQPSSQIWSPPQADFLCIFCTGEMHGRKACNLI